MATNNAVNISSAGLVKYDGTSTFSGVTTTQHAVLVGSTSNSITNLGVGTNGQVLVGSTTADPVFATLTGTGGITFTTGAGTLAINGTGGGLTWSVVTVNGTFSVNTGTIANKAGTLTMALPAASAVGDIISITGMNTATGWQVTQSAGQQIFFGTSSTTSGGTGTLTSTNIRDTITMVCIVANLTWNVINSVGNITIV